MINKKAFTILLYFNYIFCLFVFSERINLQFTTNGYISKTIKKSPESRKKLLQSERQRNKNNNKKNPGKLLKKFSNSQLFCGSFGRRKKKELRFFEE